MKVTIAYECELEDIPQTIFQLLGNIKEHDIPTLGIEVQDAILSINENNIINTLASVDQARIKLSKMDQKLLDYTNILSGYIKAETDLKLGIFPEIQEPTLEGTQEVSAQDILAEEGSESSD
jgi:hypothetical protein|tara:strand:+ start:249 stop:614 length:366 start_codon:yes stop_codon:yes gene_type:complete